MRGLLPEQAGFDIVQSEYAHQGVELDDNVVDAGLSQLVFDYGRGCNFTPTTLFGAISEAGRQIRLRPDEALASDLLEPTGRIDRNWVASAFVGIINGTIEPAEADEQTASLTLDSASSDIDACSNAERLFATSVDGIENGYIRPAQIFIDEDERPLFFRKFDGTHSVLSLRDIIVNGIPLPAGSILHIAHPDDRKTLHGYGALDTKPVITPVDEIKAGSFKRISGFALSPLRRRIVFKNATYTYPGAPSFQKRVRSLTLAKITKICEASIKATN